MIDEKEIPSTWCIERLGDFVISEKGKKRKESVYWQARSMSLHELEHITAIETLLAKVK